MDAKQTDIFLLGKTGSGKSSTGNSILGRDAFEVSDGAESETYIVQVGWARRVGRMVKVVDGPGVCETRLDRGKAAEKMARDMAQGVTQCPDGFHSLVLVLRYGDRFTEEVISVVSSLKSMFGENFVKDFCVIIFTHGEVFDMNNRKKPITFSDWCLKQTGSMKTLLAECNNRAVLFYNNSDDETKEESQLNELFSLVDGLSSRGSRYTNEMFASVAKEREALIIRENAPNLREAIQSKIDLLMDGVNGVKDATQLDRATEAKLNLLKRDAHELIVEISVQDQGTGVLNSLRVTVLNIKDNVESLERALMERKHSEDKQREIEETREKFNQQLQQLQDQVNKRKKPNFWEKLGGFAVDLFGGKLLSTAVSAVKKLF